MANHLKEKVYKFKKKGYLKIKNSVLDIGSNDGTFLNLIGKSFKRYGVDPSGTKFKKKYKKIKLINAFFSKKKIKPKDTKFDLITSFAIFYDVDNPHKFCKDIEQLLTDDGVWICEFSYLPLMLKNLTFDQICHEHLTYYTFSVFEKILKKNGLKVIDCELNEINGGSIEVIITKNKCTRISNLKLINKLKKDEIKIKNSSFRNFEKRIKLSKVKLKSFINKNYPIGGYGASTKGNIVLNYNDLDSNKIEYICDANKKKYGKFTPGSNIQIISKEKMRKLKPKYLLVLIWSFRPEIIKQELNYIKNGGNLVFHLPKFHIINKMNYKKFLNKSFKELSYKY